MGKQRAYSCNQYRFYGFKNHMMNCERFRLDTSIQRLTARIPLTATEFDRSLLWK